MEKIMHPFRTDNTDGYTDDQLVDLNARFVAAGGADLDEFEDAHERQALVERIITQYDDEIVTHGEDK